MLSDRMAEILTLKWNILLPLRRLKEFIHRFTDASFTALLFSLLLQLFVFLICDVKLDVSDVQRDASDKNHSNF